MAYNSDYAKWYYENYRKKGLTIGGKRKNTSSRLKIKSTKKSSAKPSMSSEAKARIKAPIQERLDAEKDAIRLEIAAKREELRETLRKQTEAIRERIKVLKNTGSAADIEALKEKISAIRLKGAEARLAISALSKKRIKAASDKAKQEYEAAIAKA